MPEARDSFPELESLDIFALNDRYNALAELPEADRTDEHLLEMVSIIGILRRKSAGPPRRKSASSPPVPTLDVL